jgi:excinuclease ABC subunit B
MQMAIGETNRRRAKQVRFNEEHGIVPASIHKAIRDITDQLSAAGREKAMAVGEQRAEYRARHDKASQDELRRMVQELEKRMKEAAKALQFETAAALRDELYELKAILADETELKPWERLKLLTGQD